MFSLEVRQTRLAALVGVFGAFAMLWVTSTSGCYAFVFQQPIGIGLEIRLARGPDFQRMTKGAPGDEVVFVMIISILMVPWVVIVARCYSF